MDKLKVENFGPIGKADVTFGDLTFLVGAQASGKSLFLELLKLLVDKDAIVETLRKYNYIINKNNASYLLDAFFGNGMAGAWTKDTKINFDGSDASFATSLMKKTWREQKKNCSIFLHKEFSVYRMVAPKHSLNLILLLLMCCVSLVIFYACLCR